VRAGWLAAFFPLAALAAPWEFSPPVDLTTVSTKGVFHHVESAGRKSIAVAEGGVAVVWEDNHDGVSRCYLALKPAKASRFSAPMRVSRTHESFEPSVAAMGKGRYAVGWEEDGAAWVRVTDGVRLSPSLRLSREEAGQVSLARGPKEGLYAAWTEGAGRFRQVRAARIAVEGDHLGMDGSRPVDAAIPQDEQLYPSLAVTAEESVVVAWEDRREGHTRILYTYRNKDGSFANPAALNEIQRGQAAALGLGRGSGAMRVALAAEGEDGIAAAWSDKRDFLSGYDVYAAFSSDGGRSFGKNQPVQDSFGDSFAQWHPAIAAGPHGRVAVAWDDDRDGTSDIWLAWAEGGGWSENLALPGASGEGVQSDPALALDEDGNLHVAWVEKAGDGAPTRVRYLFGRSGKK